MPDDPRTLVHVDSFEVREDGVYITGHIVPGPVADMMKTGVDYWAIRPAQIGGGFGQGDAISVEPPRPAGRPIPGPPYTAEYPIDIAQATSGLCRYDLGATTCNLPNGHEGRHDPAPMPDPYDHDPDWAIHPCGRKSGKSSN